LLVFLQKKLIQNSKEQILFFLDFLEKNFKKSRF